MMTGFREAKDRLTVPMCTNAAGTNKCNFLVIGKSAHPHSMKGVKVIASDLS